MTCTSLLHHEHNIHLCQKRTTTYKKIKGMQMFDLYKHKKTLTFSASAL
ncbi:hypothetical protein KBD08_00800 [Candidatus Babeliales bacterium]|nr:hypothetical protein [Candidatus Babeliales bacterium]